MTRMPVNGGEEVAMMVGTGREEGLLNIKVLRSGTTRT